MDVIFKFLLVMITILICGSLISILVTLSMDWLRKKTDSILVPIAIVIILAAISTVLILKG